MDLLFLNIGTTEMLFLFLPLIFVIYCIYDIITNDNVRGNKKLLWLFVVLVFNIIGCLIYWLVERNTAAKA